MSHSTTSAGQRVRGVWRCSARNSPPARAAARRLRRQSGLRPRGSGVTAGGDGLDRQGQARQHPAGLRSLFCRHLLEVERAQAFLGRRGLRCIDLDFRLVILRGLAVQVWGLRVIQKRLRRALCRRVGCLFLGHVANRGQHHGHHVFQIARVAPIQAEHLRENLPFLWSVDKDGVQRPVKIGLAVEPRRRDGLNGCLHPPRPYGQARAAQRAREMGDVVAQLGVIGQRKLCIGCHG